MNKTLDKFLIILIITDLGFICLHFLNQIGRLPHYSYSLYADFGYSEIFQYIKEFWIFLMLIFAFIERKRFNYLAWSLLFLYFLADDALKVHERIGRVLSQDLTRVYGLKAVDYGELVVTVIAGTIIFSFILITYNKSKSFEKWISKKLFSKVLVLVFFAVGVDMLHSAIPSLDGFLGVLEDGGELFVMSLILAFVFKLDIFSTEFDTVTKS